MILVARMFPMIHTCRMFPMTIQCRTTLIVGNIPVSGGNNTPSRGEHGEKADKK